MANFDDLSEHRHRFKLGLALAPLLGLACWYWALAREIGDPLRADLWDHPASWVSLSPFVLGWFALLYRFLPYKNGRIGSAPQGDKPRMWREGNPAIRQPSGAGSWVMALVLCSVMGCVGMLALSDPLTSAAFPLMYISLALLFYMIMAQARWAFAAAAMEGPSKSSPSAKTAAPSRCLKNKTISSRFPLSRSVWRTS